MSTSNATIFLPPQPPLQSIPDSYGTITGSQTVANIATSGLPNGMSTVTVGGIQLVSDPYVPAGTIWAVDNGFAQPFKYNFSGKVESYGQINRKKETRPRELPVMEPEITEFERSISFDD